MKTFIRFLIGTALLLSATTLIAQNQAVLSYFEDASGDFRIVSSDAEQERSGNELSFGDEIPVGWTVLTGAGDSAELMLEPNGTIIKLAENTNFTVEGLSGVDGKESNDFALGFGTFRAIAARLTGKESYNVRGLTTVCGVRGTDFGMTIDTAVESAFVFSGQIEFGIQGGASLLLSDGQFADALAASFEAMQMTASQIADLQGLLDFDELDPETVQQTVETLVDTPPETETEASESSEPGMLDFLAGIIGLEIGSLTVGDETYAKAVITPTFSVGKLSTSLYLPVIYKDDLFNPNDWYEPAGNNEWSFGTDQGDDIADIASDAVRDLALKIKYLQWGEQRDPFFFKLGNMSTFTVGHGLIMKDYANDGEFPAVRKVGLNLGMDFNTVGFEAFASDLADIEIVGGRIYFRPAPQAFPLAIGATALTDLTAARTLPESDPAIPSADEIGDPILLNVGLDAEYPLVERDSMAVILFGDIAGLMPYYREDGTGVFAGSIESGLDTGFLFDDGIQNYGLATGVLGNAGPIDYRAEWRYFTGAFIPSIFDSIYDKQRPEYALRTAAYSLDPSADEFQGTNMGIYGEAGYTLENIFNFSAGYLWPFRIVDGKLKGEDRDYLHLEATLEQGVIPVVDLGVSVAYDRWFFLPMLFEDKEGTAFFDANTAFKTTVIYGVSEAVDLVLIGTTTLARDENGELIYDNNDKPDIATTISIETQIHF